MPVRLSLLLLALLLAAPAAAQASPRQVMSFEAPSELLDDSRRDAALDQIRSFGVTRVRQLVYWKQFAPNPARRTRPDFDAASPDAYPPGVWAPLDKLLASAEARGIEVTLTLTGPVPKWATAKRRGYLKRPSPRQFELFATAVGRRYGGRVSTWSIWNEPNQPQFLLPQYRGRRPVSPRLYRRLYLAGQRGLRASRSNRRDDILIGETSPRGNRNVVHPLAFLRGMLCLDSSYRKARTCGRLDADGYAHHAYTTRTGPRFVPPDRDDVTIGVLTRLVSALDRAGRARALPRGLPIHLTEFGIQSTPDRRSGVSLARQPAYYAIAEHIAYVNPRVASFSQYLLRDDLPRKSGYRYSGFESGLLRADGRPKPAFAAFPNPLAVENYGDNDVLWGLIRPQRDRRTALRLEVRRGGRWRLLTRLTTTSSGVFGVRTAHRDGQEYRVRWTADDGRRFTGPPIRAY
jgi:hypothetical protein